MPKLFLQPMLAQDSTEVEFVDGKAIINSKFFGNAGYIMEIKFDGARYILQFDEDGRAYLTSRHISVETNEPTDKTENLRGYLFEDCKALAGCALDGEIVVAEKCGEKPDGSPLWNIASANGSSLTNKIMLAKPDKAKERLKDPNIKLIYVVYDILQFKGKDVTPETLAVRKALLEQALVNADNSDIKEMSRKHWKMSINYKNDKATFERLLADGHEGVMLKDVRSPYVQGDHSKHWQKVKRIRTEDGVILGARQGTGKYKDTMGALIVGQFFVNNSQEDIEHCAVTNAMEKGVFEHNGKYYYWGKQDALMELRECCTISGMTDEQRKQFWTDIGSMPHKKETDKNGVETRWLSAKKDLVCCEFIAQEKTAAKYRHPRFMQVRADKNIWDCVF